MRFQNNILKNDILISIYNMYVMGRSHAHFAHPNNSYGVI